MVYSGQAMLWLLIVIMLARPVHKYLKFKYLMKYRRQLGWALTGISLVHFSYWVGFYYSPKVLLTSFTTLWFISGLSAFFILMSLGGISNNRSVKKIGSKRWKTIQKWGTYSLPILSIVHAHYAVRGINWELILYLVPLLLLLSWRFQETIPIALMASMILGLVYVNFSGLQIEREQNIAEILTEEDDGTFLIGSTKARLTELGDIEYVCDQVYEDSISCGWPVYLADGTRYDSPSDLPR